MSNNSSCLYYSNSEFIPVAALRAGTGVFSALCCLAVIIVIVKLKRYSKAAQRLVLYLAIAATFHSISYTFARVNYYTPRYIYDDYCYFGGFFNFYSSWVEVFALFCLTFNLFYNGVMIKKPPLWLERAYLVVMYGLPLLWSWVPFLFQTYATTEGWCDTRLEDENCNPFLFGTVMLFAWYVPVYLVLFLCCLTSIVAAIRIRNLYMYGTVLKDPELKNSVLTLIGYPIVYLLLTVFSLANAIYTAVDRDNTTASLVLWYLRVVTSPFRGAVIAVVYAIHSCVHNKNDSRRDEHLSLLGDPNFSSDGAYHTCKSDASWLNISVKERVQESRFANT